MDPSPLPAGLASISPAHLHILVVDPAVAIDLVAEVRRDRPFTQVTLDVADVAVANSTVAVHGRARPPWNTDQLVSPVGQTRKPPPGFCQAAGNWTTLSGRSSPIRTL